jgi:hypothetical protein
VIYSLFAVSGVFRELILEHDEEVWLKISVLILTRLWNLVLAAFQQYKNTKSHPSRFIRMKHFCTLVV